MDNYLPGISVITPTGDRPEALQRCKFYLERQKLLPNQWIISDDSKSFSPIKSDKFEVIHRQRPHSDNKAKSFTGNILNCLSAIRHDHVFIFEDDDWYSPEYTATYMRFFQEGFQLVGEDKAIYYNVRTQQYRVNGNTNRASFCQTAFTSKVICKLKKMCEIKRESAFVDARLWNYARENKWKYKLFSGKRLAIGLKGLPGRSGIGIGHRPSARAYHADPKWKILEKFIGKDVEFYKNLS